MLTGVSNWPLRTRLLWERATARVLCRLPLKELTDPVFIVGCGRSGTTIFGNVLGKHPDIVYLNEPRHLWAAAFPSTDIWSRLAAFRRGQLCMSALDADPIRSQMLRRVFGSHLPNGPRRKILLEKTPINSFRLPFLHAIFPQARFIYLTRDGRDVATSIAREIERGRWYGAKDFKWRNLINSIADVSLRELALSTATPYERGLIEWRLCTEAIRTFREQFPSVAFFTVTYEEFVTNPEETTGRAFEFIGLSRSQFVERLCSAMVRPRESSAPSVPTPREILLGGDLLSEASNRLNRNGAALRPQGV